MAVLPFQYIGTKTNMSDFYMSTYARCEHDHLNYIDDILIAFQTIFVKNRFLLHYYIMNMLKKSQRPWILSASVIKELYFPLLNQGLKR